MLSGSLVVKCVGGSLEGTPVPAIANLLPVIQSRFRIPARETGLGFRNVFIAASSYVENGGGGGVAWVDEWRG